MASLGYKPLSMLVSLWAAFEVLLLLITPKVIALCENHNQADTEHVGNRTSHVSRTAKNPMSQTVNAGSRDKAGRVWGVAELYA